MKEGFPDNWATALLADLLLTLESGSRPRGGVRGIKEGVPSIGGEHLSSNGNFDFASVRYVPIDFADKMTKGRICPEDVLIVKDGATTGKTAFVGPDFPFPNAVVNEHVFICRPTPKINSRFLFRYLVSKQGQDQILENFKGSAQGGINRTFAPNIVVPIPPLPEQKRIVAKLEALLSKVYACRQRLEKIPTLLKRFRQSVLAAACSGRLTADWRSENPDSNNAVILVRELEKAHIIAGGHKKGNAAPPTEEAHDLSMDEIPSSWSMTDLRTAVLPERPITYGILKLRAGQT